MTRTSEYYFRKGLLSSAIGHLALFVAMFINILFHDDNTPEVYSVSFEGGASLGGISQLPKDDKKTPVAPPKKVQEEQREKEEKEKQRVKEVKKEDAEISVAKSTPSPTPTPKPTPSSTPKATPTAKGTPQTKATLAPTAKPTVKPTVKPIASRPPTLEEINKRLQNAVQRYTGESTDAGGQGYGSAATGGSGMGGGKVMPPAFFIYKKQIETHIKAGWRWHDQTQSVQAKVCFKISERGEISGVRLCQSSGNIEYDESVHRAVVKGNPLPPPPPEVYQYFREVNMTFNPVD